MKNFLKKDIAIWIILFFFSFLFYPTALSSSWISNSDIHALLEFSASSAGFMSAILILILFIATGRIFFLIISLGFTLQATEDLIHAIYSFSRLWSIERSDLINFIPGTYVTGRLILVTSLFLALFAGKTVVHPNFRIEKAISYNIKGFLIAGFTTLIIINSPLPQFILPGHLMSRPVDFIVGCLYFLVLVLYIRIYYKSKYNIPFTWSIIGSLIFGFATQVYMVHSQNLYDAQFDISHIMKIISYFFPIGGISVGMLSMYKQKEISSLSLKEKTEKLSEEIHAHKCTMKKMDKMMQDLEKANNDLRQTTDQLIQTEKLSALGEMAAGVAHELNQPLNGIKIISQSIQRDISKDSLNVNNLNLDLIDINGQVNKMPEIIDHMRHSTRTTKGTDLDYVNLNDVFENSLILLKQRLRNYSIQVEKKYSEDLPKIKINQIQIEQVFSNIIVNAGLSLEKLSDRDKKIILKTYKTKNEESITCAVIDNGDGIPKEIQKKIFQPFFTTREPGKGTGLGLSVANRIINQHNGKIELKSEEGKGAQFMVILPITQ